MEAPSEGQIIGPPMSAEESRMRSCARLGLLTEMALNAIGEIIKVEPDEREQARIAQGGQNVAQEIRSIIGGRISL